MHWPANKPRVKRSDGLELLFATCPEGKFLNRLAADSFPCFGYDAGNRVTSIRNGLSDGSPLAYFIYDYDAGSRITSIQRENGDIMYWGYDDAD